MVKDAQLLEKYLFGFAVWFFVLSLLYINPMQNIWIFILVGATSLPLAILAVVNLVAQLIRTANYTTYPKIRKYSNNLSILSLLILVIEVAASFLSEYTISEGVWLNNTKYYLVTYNHEIDMDMLLPSSRRYYTLLKCPYGYFVCDIKDEKFIGKDNASFEEAEHMRLLYTRDTPVFDIISGDIPMETLQDLTMNLDMP